MIDCDSFIFYKMKIHKNVLSKYEHSLLMEKKCAVHVTVFFLRGNEQICGTLSKNTLYFNKSYRFVSLSVIRGAGEQLQHTVFTYSYYQSIDTVSVKLKNSYPS